MVFKKLILVFLGPPASGKGTQAEILGKDLGIPVISMGELLRHEYNHHTKMGREIEKYLKKGELVPDNIIQKILLKRLKKEDVKRGFILDGFPRRIEQIVYLEKIKQKFLSPFDFLVVFYIRISDREAKVRVVNRRVCECGAAYHLKYNPPKKKGICDICGKKIYRRQDDDPKIVNKRLKDFHHRIKPILNYFADKNVLIEINGEQRIEKVQKEIKNKLNKFLNFV